MEASETNHDQWTFVPVLRCEDEEPPHLRLRGLGGSDPESAGRMAGSSWSRRTRGGGGQEDKGEEQDAEKRSECRTLITEELTDGEKIMESCQSLKLLVVCLMMSAASQQVGL